MTTVETLVAVGVFGFGLGLGIVLGAFGLKAIRTYLDGRNNGEH